MVLFLSDSARGAETDPLAEVPQNLHNKPKITQSDVI